jgi:IS1 family transposase
MNKLTLEKRIQILHLLCEGNSLRATSRISGAAFNTVVKLLIDAGKACMMFHDMVMREIPAERIQCDEIWSYVYSKQSNTTPGTRKKGAGDVWTWVALDQDTRLVISYWVGARELRDAYNFMSDLAPRLKGRVQISTDGLNAYVNAIAAKFPQNVDHGQIVKVFGKEIQLDAEKARKYSPRKLTGIEKRTVRGTPDPDTISTSLVERQNLTMRTQIKRFTRLTNAFSKKFQNHCYAIALHFVHYNFCRIHKTLRVTPAMEAGLHDDILEIEDIVNMIDAEFYSDFPVRSRDESYYKPVRRRIN